jgi:hypothetical protein
MQLLRMIAGSWLSRIYLLTVVGVTIWVITTMVGSEHPDANFAPIWIIFLTLPVSFLATAFAVLGHGVGTALALACVVLGAVVNAAVLGGVETIVRRALHRDRGAAPERPA